MKKLTPILIGLLFFTACSKENKKENSISSDSLSKESKITISSENKNEKNLDENKSQEENQTENVMLSQNDEWLVEGQWRLKVNYVKNIDERSEYYDKNPAQVVLIDYSYENLGWSQDGVGLYINPLNVLDEKNEMADPYPSPIDLTSAKETPIGEKMMNAQATFALNNKSKVIKVCFNNYLIGGDSHKEVRATFTVDVNN